MKKAMPWLSNCIVFGERKPYMGMFVSLTCTMDPATMRPTDQLEGASLQFLKSIGSDATTYSAAKKCEKLAAALTAGMGKGNEEAISRAQTPRFWVFLDEDLSMPADTLGPTLKMKRGNVYKQNAQQIEAAYEANNAKRR